MELVLIRDYLPKGTNGDLLMDGEFICHTIELPWRDNAHALSCIPEGSYPIHKRFSEKFKWHLCVCDVPDRDLILLHPANDAAKQLEGCIAPVSFLTGEGCGDASRKAFEKLNELVFPLIEKGEAVFITIKI